MRKIEYTIEQIQILEELLRRLNGKCSAAENTCPNNIDYELFPKGHQRNWICEDCGDMFAFVFGGDCEALLFSSGCPCNNPKTKPVAVSTVEEIVAEYNKKQKEEKWKL